MAEQSINAEARRFLDDHISSVAQLDLLLLLRTNPERTWEVDELVRELRVEPAWARAQLEALSKRGLVLRGSGSDVSFRFSPQTGELEQAVTAVAQAYLLNRVSVIELIYSKPSENIRAFADAFRLRREPPRG